MLAQPAMVCERPTHLGQGVVSVTRDVGTRQKHEVDLSSLGCGGHCR